MTEDLGDFVHTDEEHQLQCVQDLRRCPNCEAATGTEHWWQVGDDHRCPPEAMAQLNRALGLEEP